RGDRALSGVARPEGSGSGTSVAGLASMRTGINADRLHYGARTAARPWVEKLARAGYAAKGVLYVTIGSLALMLAVGEGGQTAGSRDALAMLGQQPFGQILLFVMAVGLAGYAL